MAQGGSVQNPGDSLEFFLVPPCLPGHVKRQMTKPHTGKSIKISDPSEIDRKSSVT